jgi:hypothetical protein
MKNVELKTAWDEFFKLLSQLSIEEQDQCYETFKLFLHKLRQDIGVIYTSEALLRRETEDDADEDILELLNAIQIAQNRVLDVITDLTHSVEDFASK